MSENAGKLADNSESYNQHLSEANKQLAAINSVYEMQINSFSDQIKASQGVTSQLEAIKEHFGKSIDTARTYQEEVGKLNQTIGELNTIYGNMLSAMNLGSNHRS
jgi:gliding motility-associated protein GldL